MIEKAALFRLNIHVKESNLLKKNQSAYRQFHSCESALLRLVNDILEGMEEQEVTALIAIYLSAAFDTVDHDILLDVLQKQYGACGTALNWILVSSSKKLSHKCSFSFIGGTFFGV